MKRILIFLLLCAVLASSCLAADYTVTKLNAAAVVSEKGNCTVTHTVDIRVDQPIAEIVVPVAREGSSFSLSGVSGKIFRADGCAYARLKPGEGFTGNLTAVVSYETRGTVSAVEQGQNFRLMLVSDLWEEKVERFNFSVVLPKETAAQPSFFSGYRADDVEDDLTTAKEGRAISGQLRGGLLDRESFMLDMTVAEGYFPAAAAAAPEASSGVLAWICGVLGCLLTAAGIYYWVRFLRSGRLKVQARTMPPEGLSPAEVTHLLCSGKPDLGLLVCHWGALGYLTVTANSAGRVLLRKSMEMGTERREEERQIFEALFGASDVCEAGGSRYKRTAELCRTVLSRYWIRRLFDRTSGSPLLLRAAAVLVAAMALMSTMSLLLAPGGAKWLFVLIAFVAGGACGAAVIHGCARLAVKDWPWVAVGGAGFLILYFMASFGGGMFLMLVALAMCIFTGVVTCCGGRRTAAGSDMMEQTRGFCHFLVHAEDRHLTQMLQTDGQFFYAMALYAAACGQGRRFARRFDGLKLDACEFIRFAGETGTSASAWYRRFEELRKALKD